MRVTILGTGAMACLFGARLAAQSEVTLVGAWAEGVAAINERGVVVEDAHGATTVRVQAHRLGADIVPADVALILVKAWQTPRVASHVRSLLKETGVALTLQNGLGNYEILAEAIGADRVALGMTTQGATLLGPGRVREGGRGVTHIPDASRLNELTEAFRAAGFEILQSPLSNLQSLVWGKLVINCGINALTALLRVPNGELLARPDATLLMERAAQECAVVAAAQGIALPFAEAAAQARAVAERTASNHSSMFQDILRGAPTEIDAINGAVVQAGERLGVPAPVNETLWRLVKAMSNG